MRLSNIIQQGPPKAGRITSPYIIAEAGVNHEGNMDLARRLIDEALEGGASAIKFQTYKAETIASRNSPAYWDLDKEKTPSQYELFKKYDRFWKIEFEELRKYCDLGGIEFLSTPFDFESARFLNDLMDVFKISSSDITNKPFIEYICSFEKPIVLSTGASNLDEISEAVSWIDSRGNSLGLLHCILNYPTEDHNANLGMILDLKDKFPNKVIGYSDHTLPGKMKILEVAVLLGAVILEKHFTHDKTLPGNDHYHAMDKDDLKYFRKKLGDLQRVLGSFEKVAIETEFLSRQNARRSLVANRFIPSGKAFEKEDLTFKRPAHGISPREIDKVLGRHAARDIEQDTILGWDYVK